MQCFCHQFRSIREDSSPSSVSGEPDKVNDVAKVNDVTNLEKVEHVDIFNCVANVEHIDSEPAERNTTFHQKSRQGNQGMRFTKLKTSSTDNFERLFLGFLFNVFFLFSVHNFFLTLSVRTYVCQFDFNLARTNIYSSVKYKVFYWITLSKRCEKLAFYPGGIPRSVPPSCEAPRQPTIILKLNTWVQDVIV